MQTFMFCVVFFVISQWENMKKKVHKYVVSLWNKHNALWMMKSKEKFHFYDTKIVLGI